MILLLLYHPILFKFILICVFSDSTAALPPNLVHVRLVLLADHLHQNRQSAQRCKSTFLPQGVLQGWGGGTRQCAWTWLWLRSSFHHMPKRYMISCYGKPQTIIVGIAQWLERRTRDRKVAGSNPCWSGGRIFFSRVNFLCWLLFWYLFHPRVTAVAHKRPRSFCQKRRWQVTAKHAYTSCMWLYMKWHGVWCTQNAPRWQHILVAPAMPAL